MGMIFSFKNRVILACGVTTNTAFSASNSGIIDVMFGLNAPACTIGIAAPLPYTKVQVTCTGTIPGASPMVIKQSLFSI